MGNILYSLLMKPMMKGSPSWVTSCETTWWLSACV